jgi:UDP-glucose 4-epimerase
MALVRRVVITGGTGYIGSHVAVQFLGAGAQVALIDDLRNSSPGVADAIVALGGRDVPLHRIDVRDRAAVATVLRDHAADAVVHCAGLKAVGESIEQPVAYWDVNVGGTISVLGAMADAGTRDIVFSSSATVYGEPEVVPIAEDAATGPVNPYGRTKLAVEQLLEDAAASGSHRAVALRYFNPVGAHPSGRIGEMPTDRPNNLMPRVLDVAVGEMDALPVFGTDYATPDGTCIRDYLHVCDLADGHGAPLDAIDEIEPWSILNHGNGGGN